MERSRRSIARPARYPWRPGVLKKRAREPLTEAARSALTSELERLGAWADPALAALRK